MQKYRLRKLSLPTVKQKNALQHRKHRVDLKHSKKLLQSFYQVRNDCDGGRSTLKSKISYLKHLLFHHTKPTPDRKKNSQIVVGALILATNAHTLNKVHQEQTHFVREQQTIQAILGKAGLKRDAFQNPDLLRRLHAPYGLIVEQPGVTKPVTDAYANGIPEPCTDKTLVQNAVRVNGNAGIDPNTFFKRQSCPVPNPLGLIETDRTTGQVTSVEMRRTDPPDSSSSAPPDPRDAPGRVRYDHTLHRLVLDPLPPRY